MKDGMVSYVKKQLKLLDDDLARQLRLFWVEPQYIAFNREVKSGKNGTRPVFQWSKQGELLPNKLKLLWTSLINGDEFFVLTKYKSRTMFVIDFDLEMPIIDQKLKDIELTEEEKERIKKDILQELGVIREEILQSHYDHILKQKRDYYASIYKEKAIIDYLNKLLASDHAFYELNWKSSGGWGRRHAFAFTRTPINPRRFEGVYHHLFLHNKLMPHRLDTTKGRPNLSYEGKVVIDNVTYPYKVIIDYSLLDDKHLIRSLYSPHRKSGVTKYSYPIPIDYLLNEDYLREVARLDPRLFFKDGVLIDKSIRHDPQVESVVMTYKDAIRSWDPLPFNLEQYLTPKDLVGEERKKFIDEDTWKKTFERKIVRNEVDERDEEEVRYVFNAILQSKDMVPPPPSHDALVKLQKLEEMPCMKGLRGPQSHVVRTRFGNVATQLRISIDDIASYFYHYINDDEHNKNFAITYYNLYRLTSNNKENVNEHRYLRFLCRTFQNPKNMTFFADPSDSATRTGKADECRSCVVYKEFQANRPLHKPLKNQSPLWGLAPDLYSIHKLLQTKQQPRDMIRDEIARSIDSIIRDYVPPNGSKAYLIQAPVRSGKSYAMAKQLVSWSMRDKGIRVFYVGNIKGFKEEIGVLLNEFNGVSMEWVSKNRLCPLHRDNSSFHPSNSFCNICPLKKTTVKKLGMDDNEDTAMFYQKRGHPLNHFMEELAIYTNKIKTMDETMWIEWTEAMSKGGDDLCPYYFMRYIIKEMIYHSPQNIILIGDPSLLMNSMIVGSIEKYHRKWLNVWDLVIYDEAHSFVNVIMNELIIKHPTQKLINDGINFIIGMGVSYKNASSFWDKVLDSGKIDESQAVDTITTMTLFLETWYNYITKNLVKGTVINFPEDIIRLLPKKTFNMFKRLISAMSLHTKTIVFNYVLYDSLIDLWNTIEFMLFHHSPKKELFLASIINKIDKREITMTNERYVEEDVHSLYIFYKQSITLDNGIKIQYLLMDYLRKIVFMSATPVIQFFDFVSRPILKQNIYNFRPYNNVKLIFSIGSALYNATALQLTGDIVGVANYLRDHYSIGYDTIRPTNNDSNGNDGKVLVVVPTVHHLKAFNRTFKKWKGKEPIKHGVLAIHPRDRENSEGTTLEGFKYGIAVNISQINIHAMKDQEKLLALIFDNSDEETHKVIEELAVMRVIQSIGRIIPPKDPQHIDQQDFDTVTLLFLDKRFLPYMERIHEWLSPAFKSDYAYYNPYDKFNDVSHKGIRFNIFLEKINTVVRDQQIYNHIVDTWVYDYATKNF